MVSASLAATTRLMNRSGVGAARWMTSGQTVLTGWAKGRLGLFPSRDHTTLTRLPGPRGVTLRLQSAGLRRQRPDGNAARLRPRSIAAKWCGDETMTRPRTTFAGLLMGLAGILVVYGVPATAHAAAIVTGINFVRPTSFSVAELLDGDRAEHVSFRAPPALLEAARDRRRLADRTRHSGARVPRPAGSGRGLPEADARGAGQRAYA